MEKQIKVISREEALKVMSGNLYKLTNDELEAGLKTMGFGKTINLPHCGFDLSVNG